MQTSTDRRGPRLATCWTLRPARLIRSFLVIGICSVFSAVAHAESTDSLFIDPRGEVHIGSLQVKDITLAGDGSALKLNGVTSLKEALGQKLDTIGGTIGGNLTVTGALRAASIEVESDNPLRHRMYPADPIIYQDIFDARDKGVIARLGDVKNYDEVTYAKTVWFGRRLIRYGQANDSESKGAQVTVPQGYDTLWLRVLGDRWTTVHAFFLDGGHEDLGRWSGGYRSGNGYCPDGSLSDGTPDSSGFVRHQWIAIPVGRAGSVALVAKADSHDPSNDFWLSGLGFSRNPWSHAVESAVAYHWAINGGNSTVWTEGNWNGDSLTKILPGTEQALKVPVIPSGRDKLLYLVEHNNNWTGSMHARITVDGVPIERFLATYDNPFARHWNSKWYNRYIAARIPRALIKPEARWLTVKVEQQSEAQTGIYFRELGTHDWEVPH